MKVVELNTNDFTKLVKELDECREEKEKLQKAVNYLNEEIKKYNKEFANVKDKNLLYENKK